MNFTRYYIANMNKKPSDRDLYPHIPKFNKFSYFNTTFLRDLWKNENIHSAINAKNYEEANEWFANHPEVKEQFQKAELELLEHIKFLQDKASDYLRGIYLSERLNKNHQFQSQPIFNPNFEDVSIKSEDTKMDFEETRMKFEPLKKRKSQHF